MDKEKLMITPKPPQGEDGHTTFSVRLSNDLVEKLENILKVSGHSRNELIGIMLQYAVDNCEVAEESN